MVGVTKWSYKQSSIDERQANCDYYGDPSEMCKNEDWFMRELAQQFEEKFLINRTLTYAFMDSFSQLGPNLIDEVQQQYWIAETDKLWNEATRRNETFDFKTIDDVLEENAACKEENERLLDIIDDEIKEIKENILHLEDTIDDVASEATSNANHNAKEIVIVAEAISLVNTSLKEDVSFISSQFYKENGTTHQLIEDNRREITDNQREIEENQREIEKNQMDAAPIGTIVAWINKVDPDQKTGNIALPNGWMKCDGSNIPPDHGVWSGLYVPDLNGEKRFLRGGDDRDVLKKEDHSIQEHTHLVEDPGHYHVTTAAYDGSGHKYDGNGSGGSIGNTGRTSSTKTTNIKVNGIKDGNEGIETKPVNMNVIWIIKLY